MVNNTLKKKSLPLQKKSSVKNNLSSLVQKVKSKNSLKTRIPTTKNTSKVNPNYWVLPNRKKFIEWFDQQFEIFRKSNKSKLPESDFFPHQQLIQSYLQFDSPYRGILLYHSLGSGKSCSSILVANSLKKENKVIVMLPASLEKNYIEELKKCGNENLRLENNWTKVSANKHSKDFQVFPKTIHRYNGFWKLNKDASPNYKRLSENSKREINFQIEELISKDYTFIHYNGLRIKNVEKMEQEDGFFDNKLIIVDEIHNLISMMVGNGLIGSKIYKLMMEAENSRFVFLSGTPIINYPYELSLLFNLLRGYIKTYNFRIFKPNSKWSNKEITKLLKANEEVDQILPDERDNLLTVTKNVRFFTNKYSHIDYQGVVKNMFKNTSDHFNSNLSSLLKREGYIIKSSYQEDFTCFPEMEDEFNNKFIHPLKMTIRNADIFKRRLLGMVSYFKPEESNLIPTIKAEHIIECQMSGHQTLKYIQLRSHEIEREVKRGRVSKQKKKNNNDKENSCFRVFSRQCCNFVFPDEINRPFPTDNNSDDIEIFEMESGESQHLDTLDLKNKKKILEFELQKQQAFEELERRKNDFLSYDKLGKYSQKFVQILDNLKKSKGTSFIYSQFRSLEGIGILALVLEANGYAQFRVRKNIYTKEWEEYFENKEDKIKNKFAYYTGTESLEEKELIKKVFNNDYDNLPESLKKNKMDDNYNLYGQVIKILLATSSAAEGINLRNVRQVHIIESYWNPIRIQQVKGRAVRYKSHIQLPEEQRNVEIFQYLSILDKKEIKNVRNIYKRDKGMSSDEVVEEIANKKKNLTNSFLKLIKETSIDCNITNSGTEKINCYDFGKYHTEYSFIPDINKETEDKNRYRQIVSKNIRGAIIKFKSKIYYLDKDNKDVYDYESFKNGRYIKLGKLKNNRIVYES